MIKNLCCIFLVCTRYENIQGLNKAVTLCPIQILVALILSSSSGPDQQGLSVLQTSVWLHSFWDEFHHKYFPLIILTCHQFLTVITHSKHGFYLKHIIR